ncbi:hypothetical protein [uncultured Dokdonia sp.]|uniref:hypothetical protein n=1 Tax=uncultured Dokdonia sp. TaxID=575653 RepID=UPI002620C3BE|nr:hypothetical protein [uncultured Dokdonia sp.]
MGRKKQRLKITNVLVEIFDDLDLQKNESQKRYNILISSFSGGGIYLIFMIIKELGFNKIPELEALIMIFGIIMFLLTLLFNLMIVFLEVHFVKMAKEAITKSMGEKPFKKNKKNINERIYYTQDLKLKLRSLMDHKATNIIHLLGIISLLIGFTCIGIIMWSNLIGNITY